MESKGENVAALAKISSSQILNFTSSPSHLSIFMKIPLYYFSWNKKTLQFIFVYYDLFGFFLVLKEL